jgi:RNA polymerase sigma-70 factor (ECF subfamily)
MRLNVLTSTPPHGSEEARLRQRAREGDPRAFEEVVVTIGDVVHGAIHQILDDAEPAREVFAETVELAFADRSRCPPETSLPEWLLRRAIRAALKRAGSLHREKRVVEDDAHSPPLEARRDPRNDPGRDRDRRLNATPTGRALEQLPARSRLILYLRYYVQLLVEDVARILDLSSVHVSVSLFHALETIRRLQNLPDRGSGPGVGPGSSRDRSSFGVRSRRCTEAREHLALLKDGTLAPAKIALCRGHLRNCGDCLEYTTDLSRFEQQIRGTFHEERITIGELRKIIERAVSLGRRGGVGG